MSMSRSATWANSMYATPMAGSASSPVLPFAAAAKLS